MKRIFLIAVMCLVYHGMNPPRAPAQEWTEVYHSIVAAGDEVHIQFRSPAVLSDTTGPLENIGTRGPKETFSLRFSEEGEATATFSVRDYGLVEYSFEILAPRPAVLRDEHAAPPEPLPLRDPDGPVTETIGPILQAVRSAAEAPDRTPNTPADRASEGGANETGSPSSPVDFVAAVEEEDGGGIEIPATTPDLGSESGVIVPPEVIERILPRNLTEETSSLDNYIARPEELDRLRLAADLYDRGLFPEAVETFNSLIEDFPRSSLQELARFKIGEAYYMRAERLVEEALRLQNLRRSGSAVSVFDSAISDYEAAKDAFNDVLMNFPNGEYSDDAQYYVAASLHGATRTGYIRGGSAEENPQVVVEYLKTTIRYPESRVADEARLGIANYYRDYGDALLGTRASAEEIRAAYLSAIEEYESVIELWPNGTAADDALISMARLFDSNLEMRDFQRAVSNYERILRRFPESEYAEEARTRARYIRENYL